MTAIAAVAQVAVAVPARFWLATSDSVPAGPQVPAVSNSAGTVQTVSIWGQPATVSAGTYHAVQNPFKTLQNVSLNIVADSPEIGFLGGSATVYNPSLNSVTRRFEFVHDSTTGLSSATCAPGTFGVCGLQGFSITPSASFAGLGPVCEPGDPFCGVTASGSSAWLFGTVDVEVLHTGIEASLHLQIGTNGVNHVGESSLSTEVVFGTDSAVIYRAGIDTDADGRVDKHDRGVTLAGDGPDLIFAAGSAMLPGDFNGNGKVEQSDIDLVLLNWGKNASMVPGNWVTGSVDQEELDGVLLNWGAMAGSARGGAAVVPEQNGLPMAILMLVGTWSLGVGFHRAARASMYAGA